MAVKPYESGISVRARFCFDALFSSAEKPSCASSMKDHISRISRTSQSEMIDIFKAPDAETVGTFPDVPPSQVN